MDIVVILFLSIRDGGGIRGHTLKFRLECTVEVFQDGDCPYVEVGVRIVAVVVQCVDVPIVS